MHPRFFFASLVRCAALRPGPACWVIGDTAFVKMVMANGYASMPATGAGAPSRPPTPMPVGSGGPYVGGGVGQGAGFGTLGHRLPPTPNGMVDPHGVPAPPPSTAGASPLGMPGPLVQPPQLMGSLPFSPAVDTSHFGGPYEPSLLVPDDERARMVAATPVPSPGTGVPAFSPEFAAAVNGTPRGGAGPATPAMASEGRDPLRTLLNGIDAAPGGGDQPVLPPSSTPAFVRAPAPAPAPGGLAPGARAPVIGVAPPPIPPPPPPQTPSPSPTRRRVTAPHPVRTSNLRAGPVPAPNLSTGAAPVRAATAPLPARVLSFRQSTAGSSSGAALSPARDAATAAHGGLSAPRAIARAPRAAGTSPLAGGASASSPGVNAAMRSKKGKGRQGLSASQPLAEVAVNGPPTSAVAAPLAADQRRDGNAAPSAAGLAVASGGSAAVQPTHPVLDVEELKSNVAGVRQQLETQGKLLEQLAKTMHALKSETCTGINDIKNKVGLAKADVDANKANLLAAKDNQSKLVRIRTRLRAYAKQETAETNLTHRVFLNAGNFLDMMHVAIEDELMMSPEEAREYAMSRRVYPGRKSKTVSMRVRSLLMRSRSHTVQAYKEVLIPVYFEEIGVFKAAPRTKAGKRKRATGASLQSVADVMDKPTADNWLADAAYMTSEQGFSAIVETLKQFMTVLGASARVVAGRNVGDNDYVDCTLGHFAIVCAIVRGELEKAAGVKPQRRTGLAGGIYAEFAAEVPLADEFLPMHDVAASGLRLVDGGDENRGKLDADESAELLEEEAIDMSALEAGVVDGTDDAED